MRIAEISTLARPVPPAGEGSVESIVHNLTEGLVARGHEVTLFATEDSKTSAALQSPVPHSYRTNQEMWDWRLYEAFQVREAFRFGEDFDVIHCHSYHYGLLMCDFISTPSLHSIHIEPGPDYKFLAQRTQNRRLQFCSHYQAREFSEIHGVHIIPHGVDLNSFDFRPRRTNSSSLAFLGRFIPDKGPLEAIRIAKKAGIPLRMAAPPNEYFREVIEPECDGAFIEYVGELRGNEKVDFLSQSCALLYPLQCGEAFGLVLLEAMACGVPVVASNQGAVPEIVKHGVTGWIGETEEDLIEGLRRVETMDRAEIRKYVEENFSSESMIDRFESLLLEMALGRTS